MPQMRYNAVPQCPICVENLGKYGGPCTLPCGHNYCLQCIASQQHRNAECPLCRAAFPSDQPLSVNTGLRDLIVLASTLHTVEQDGWETITASRPVDGKIGYQDGSEPNRETDVTLMPSCPPARVSLSTVLHGECDLLSLEPPRWVPDSHASVCTTCHDEFRALRRSRHHCRLCGGIFCHYCSARQLLLPPKFQSSQPQRVCGPCADLLEPLQPFLAGTISKAVQPAVHDVTDRTAMRSWFNVPLGSSLEADIYKATNIVRAFTNIGNNPPERNIPSHILRDAAGFAILSTLKVGMGWSGVIGTGIVVGRKDDSWSAPSAISLAGIGYGFQLGGAVSDILIVLRNRSALQAFCGKVHVGTGIGASMAVGHIGRQAEAALRLGIQGRALCYSYSLTSGIFAGISFEGSAVSTRDNVNLAFYGRPVSAADLILDEKLPLPVAAASLYGALDQLLTCVGAVRPLRLSAVSDKDLHEPHHEDDSPQSSKVSPRPSAPSAPHTSVSLGRRDSYEDPPQGFPVAEDFDEEEEEIGLGMNALFAE